jgi:hypothetical protein
MNSVFIMWHTRKDDEYHDDAKLIGAYCTLDDCHAAIERLKNQPGFRDNVEGFNIDEYELGKDHWTEGFIGSDDILDVL